MLERHQNKCIARSLKEEQQQLARMATEVDGMGPSSEPVDVEHLMSAAKEAAWAGAKVTA